MKPDGISTRWDGTDIAVLCGRAVVDRIAADAIRRVILVCDGGDTPSELVFALIETAAEHVLLPAASGIAGPVYFERQPYWTGRSCIYWVTGRHAPLPRHLGGGGVWLLRRERPGLLRLPAAELSALIEQWPLQGPQTWEQRKWARIGAKRPLVGLRPQTKNPA
jgi:hypothetical protein